MKVKPGTGTENARRETLNSTVYTPLLWGWRNLIKGSLYAKIPGLAKVSFYMRVRFLKT